MDGWISGTYEYAPMQLYLARVIRVAPGTKKKMNQRREDTSDSEEPEVTFKLIDGIRGFD